VDFSYAFDVEDVYYRAKLQYGVSQSQVGFANSGMTYDFKGEDFAALSLTAEVVDWTFRLTAGTLTVGTDLPNIERYLDQPNRPAEDLIEQFMMKGDRVQYFEAAAKFDDFNWTVLSELAYTESESKLMPNGVAGYLTVGKRVEAWTPYISAAFFDAKHSPFYAEPTSSELDKYAVAILNSARIDQRSISIGVRWDWTPQSALTLQWDHYFISKYGSSLWSEVEDEVPRDQQVDLFSIAIAFVF
jgi:ribosomal protein S17E